MLFSIIIIVISLVFLMALHELGHFIAAKRFGVKVEEFGIGYPPRILSRKFGETVYSLNLLPFGAFVKVLGEDEEVDGDKSFSKQPIWKRAIVLAGGVVSFWIIAIVIYGLVIGFWGMSGAIDDKAIAPNAMVLVMQVTNDSPAQKAGVKAGDIIEKVKSQTNVKNIGTVTDLQIFIKENKGLPMTIVLKRGQNILDATLTPRVETPTGEGPIGVGLVRITKMRYPWYQVPYRSATLVVSQTKTMAAVLGDALLSLVWGKKVEGLQLVGPIGVGSIMNQAIAQGFDVFLSYLGMIAVWMALFNFLPIPSLDGGKLFFLAIEAIRRKPLPVLIEQKITGVFFFALIALMAVVTIKDIIHLF